MSPHQEEARRRIQSALKSIEAAQIAIDFACSQISPVLGLVRDWERLGKAADKVKAEWHRLNERTEGKLWELDEDTRSAFDARKEGGP